MNAVQACKSFVPRLNRSSVCECGRTKTRRLEACLRCLWLEGGTRATCNSAATSIVAVLRLRGFSTAGEIAWETGVKHNTVNAALLRLAARHRVRKMYAAGNITDVYYCLQDRGRAS